MGTSSQCTPPSPPIIQKTIPRTFELSGANDIISCVIALHNIDIDIPVRTSLELEYPLSLEAMKYTMTIENIAPINAIKLVLNVPRIGILPQNAMDKAANIPAPDWIPNVYGSAIIFPVIACMIEPVIAKPPPTAMATSILGSLTFQTILFKLISSKVVEKK